MATAETVFEPQTSPSMASPRAIMLKERLLAVTPAISYERAELVTESYKKTEGLPIILRKAKALENILAKMTILIQPETRWETFADQSLASLGYYQNWELSATASNYLRAGEAVSPLQHIWSMSVQGQFYIMFLILIL